MKLIRYDCYQTKEWMVKINGKKSFKQDIFITVLRVLSRTKTVQNQHGICSRLCGMFNAWPYCRNKWIPKRISLDLLNSWIYCTVFIYLTNLIISYYFTLKQNKGIEYSENQGLACYCYSCGWVWGGGSKYSVLVRLINLRLYFYSFNSHPCRHIRLSLDLLTYHYGKSFYDIF